MLETKIASQQSIVAVKQKEYENAVKAYGADAQATQKALNALLEAKITLAELQKSMGEVQTKVTQSQGDSLTEYMKLITETSKDMKDWNTSNLTPEEIDAWARRKSGYTGNIHWNPVLETAEEVKETVEVVKTTVDTAADDIKESAVACTEAMAEGVTQGVESVADAASEVTDVCTETVESKKNDWSQGGATLVENFAEGIKSNVTTAVEAATEMAQAAVIAVNEVFNPESVDIGGMSDVMTNLEQSVNNSTGAEGSISPVMDPSSEAPTMAFIDGIITRLTSDLNLTISDLASELASVISAGDANIVDAINKMSGKEYFQEMVAAINSLKGDISALGSRIGSMSVKMDSGVLVGEIKAKIDNALGQISIHKGRGN